MHSRRQFLGLAGIAGLAACGLGSTGFAGARQARFKISLAQWSLHKTLFNKKLDNLDFAKFTKDNFGIEAIEYVNQFFKDKAENADYLSELNSRAADCGVKQLLIMIDGEGQLGDPDAAARTQAVENHFRWVTAAKTLGCHSIRVNAGSKGSRQEQHDLVVDGLGRLTEFAAKHEINVIVENHGGLSSDGEWLAGVLKAVNNPRCGSLPDFGNFYDYDRYKGVQELMPFAKGVSAKSHDFNDAGEETKTDYRKMMKIVSDSGYTGFVGIEYEGSKLDEVAGIKATKALLEKVFADLG